MPTSQRLPLSTGLTYHALTWGDPAAEHVVLLVHGFLDLSWTWSPVVDTGRFAGCYVVAPDLRGHGDSDRVGPGGYYHFMDYVADLDALVDLLLAGPAGAGSRRLSIVGHSMGGMVSSYWAGTYPERVHRVALLEGLGPPESDSPLPERVRQWISGWRRVHSKGPESRQGSYASVAEAAERLRHHDPRLSEGLARLLAEHGTRPGAADGRLRFKHDPLHLTRGPYPFYVSFAEPFWRGLQCPVLIVDGAETDFHYDAADLARRLQCFADARTAVLPGAGHMMQRHQPEALAQMLAEFLL